MGLMMRLGSSVVFLVAFSAFFGSEAVAQAWTVNVRTDPFSDERTVISAIHDRAYSIIVRCENGELNTYISMGYVGDDDASVRYRIDQGEVHEEVWGASTDRQALFAAQPVELARWLAAGSRFAYEYINASGTPRRQVIPLTGSAGPINRALDACDLPRRDPRETDHTIWRRAVIDLDSLPKDLVAASQALLNRVGYPSPTHGRRDQATYAALSRFYEEYWAACRGGSALTQACETWRRYGPPEDYPVEPLMLLLEVAEVRATAAAAVIASASPPAPAPSLRPEDATGEIDDFEWSRAPMPHFPERALDRGVEAGVVILRCGFRESGALTSCSIDSEVPVGAGFGREALAASRRAVLSARQMDIARSAGEVIFTLRFD